MIQKIRRANKVKNCINKTRLHGHFPTKICFLDFVLVPYDSLGCYLGAI